jgi:hypothetical protein
MKETKQCPVCHGNKNIWITDYVQRMRIEHSPIECPACLGAGIIRLETRQQKGGIYA